MYYVEFDDTTPDGASYCEGSGETPRAALCDALDKLAGAGTVHLRRALIAKRLINPAGDHGPLHITVENGFGEIANGSVSATWPADILTSPSTLGIRLTVDEQTLAQMQEAAAS